MRCRSVLPVALALVPTLWAPTAAQAAPSITEYPAGSKPRSVALGADGNVWFTDDKEDAAIGRITPAGVVTMFSAGLDDDAELRGITAGPGGLWFTERDENKIGRITTNGTIREFDAGRHEKPEAIVAGPDGNLWYTSSGGGGAIARITPTGTVTEFETASDSQDITLGADGNLWFTTPNARRIGRITPQGAITEFPTGRLGGTPREIAAGPDGSLWFTQDGHSPAIGRITTTGTVTQFSIGLPPSSVPRGIATGADGNVYFTDSGTNAIGRITPSGAISEFSSGLTDDADLRGITTGADGRLWFAERANAKLGRMTVAPTAGAVTASVVTDASARVSSTVTANSQATSYSFQWGTTTAYGQSTANTSADSGATAQPVESRLSGLSPSTTYHVRLTATNDTGTTYGPDHSFTTAPAPTPPAPAPPAPAETPPAREDAPPAPAETPPAREDAAPAPSGPSPTPAETAPAPSKAPPAPATTPPAPDASPVPAPVQLPVVGSTAVAAVTSGTVRFRAPGSSAPVEVRYGAAIPSGSVLDTRYGTIALWSAVDRNNNTQIALFRGAIFRMALSKRTGMVDIRLTGAPTCPSRRFAARAARASKAPVKLWGKDSNGRYRTHGRNSVAIVRGTEWTTTETCAGTRTRVIEGSVSVTNRRTGKRKLVRAGQSYLARTRR